MPPPTPTPQVSAINGANTQQNICATLVTLRAQIADLIKAYNHEGWSAEWSAFPTAPKNADGSLGAADATPNTAHPIDTRVLVSMNRAVTATQLIAEQTMFVQLINFFTNVAVTQGDYGQTIDDGAS